jgi:hypothetical protein
MTILWPPFVELDRALLTWPWLETFGTVAAASAWPLAIFGIVLLLRRQAVALLAALVKRVDDLEEMKGPAGISARFFGKGIGKTQDDLASMPPREPLPESRGVNHGAAAHGTEDPAPTEGGGIEPRTAEGDGVESKTAEGRATPELSETKAETERTRRQESDSARRHWGDIYRRDLEELRFHRRREPKSKFDLLGDAMSEYYRSQREEDRPVIERLAEISPRSAVVEAFIPVEAAATRFVRELDNNPRGNAVIAFRRLSIVPDALKNAVQSLSQMRNQAAHEADLQFTQQAVLDYAATAEQAALEIDELRRTLPPRPNDN